MPCIWIVAQAKACFKSLKMGLQIAGQSFTSTSTGMSSGPGALLGAILCISVSSSLIVSAMWGCAGGNAGAAEMSERSGACGTVKKRLRNISAWSLGADARFCGPSGP